MGESSQVAEGALGEAGDVVAVKGSEAEARVRSCLLYTSDAADE